MQTILKIPGFMDNVYTHLLAGLGAGLFAVFIGSPVDVVGATASLPFFCLQFALTLKKNTWIATSCVYNEKRLKKK